MEYIESGTYYSTQIKQIKKLNFKSIRSLSIDFAKELTEDLKDRLYGNVLRGASQLQSEAELLMYLYSFGLMHEAKLQYAFKQLPNEFFDNPTIDIIDYGCGQAIGTICYADFLIKNNKFQKVRKIILIEPSEIALKRAALHVSRFFPNAEIITILKEFDDLDNNDLCIDEGVPTLHVFSNVLDLADFFYDLEQFASLIKNCSIGENYYMCVGPYFGYEEKDEKLYSFVNLLNSEICYSEFFLKETFVEGRDWTCHVVISRTICEDFYSKNTLVYRFEDPLDFTHKWLKTNKVRYIENCKIKNIEYDFVSSEDVIVKIILVNQINGLLSDDSARGYKIENTNIIYTSLSAISMALLDSENLNWIRGIIFEKPQLLNILFNDGTVDIIQYYISNVESYINPNVYKDINDKMYNYDVLINHCINFKTSKKVENNINEILNVANSIFNYNIFKTDGKHDSSIFYGMYGCENIVKIGKTMIPKVHLYTTCFDKYLYEFFPDVKDIVIEKMMSFFKLNKLEAMIIFDRWRIFHLIEYNLEEEWTVCEPQETFSIEEFKKKISVDQIRVRKDDSGLLFFECDRGINGLVIGFERPVISRYVKLNSQVYWIMRDEPMVSYVVASF